MTETSAENYFNQCLIKNDFLLAPMAGVTDAAFRSLCIDHGAMIVFTEMISAKGMMYNNANTVKLMQLAANEKNTGIQIFGNDAEIMSEAIKRYINNSDFAFVDINMGCPVKKITGNGEGSALLSNPILMYSVASAIKKASIKPVSAKIRIGVDANHINAVENIRILEEAGIDMVTVHGRTKEQMYSGKANLDAIASAVSAVKIPVTGNGDVCDAQSYAHMKAYTGCAGVMTGRAAMGNPFIFDEIQAYRNNTSYTQPTTNEKINAAVKHFNLLLETLGEETACREFRKQICWYTKGLSGGSKIRGSVSTLNRKEDFFVLLENLA